MPVYTGNWFRIEKRSKREGPSTILLLWVVRKLDPQLLVFVRSLLKGENHLLHWTFIQRFLLSRGKGRGHCWGWQDSPTSAANGKREGNTRHPTEGTRDTPCTPWPAPCNKPPAGLVQTRAHPWRNYQWQTNPLGQLILPELRSHLWAPGTTTHTQDFAADM